MRAGWVACLRGGAAECSSGAVGGWPAQSLRQLAWSKWSRHWVDAGGGGGGGGGDGGDGGGGGGGGGDRVIIERNEVSLAESQSRTGSFGGLPSLFGIFDHGDGDLGSDRQRT